ncbi:MULTISPECIES: sugar ABC transporter substrate-binding protein [unclassified Streptomyces]|uniref:ABC transporter substrate-binding protein n=1 Tax=unclassified Streptomyces TaxID=2593676 RepID=UPI002E2AEB80|nr:sugar ABC transporter substrate-binding protein [Streptomyces sp. NBC_01423]WSX93949.1 sugar ABC transporter substrate-binding protein [Streptomyces sp. NBC_00891]WSY08426.1 sugar ABC transporter substrate-binding protein [Streptomyces sp. NBC_00890]WSZ10049.1 sugar ABC transporter substrate-binding protein [Streptomyces sp. NBC_00869]WSZ22448.1 sugar ABC transporter substrate-binding protein [Streptomyces sp. NBC_00870]
MSNRFTPRVAVPLTVVSALIGGAVLSGCGQQRDPDVYTVLNSSTDESYHRWDAQTLARCGKQLGVTIEQQSVPAAQVMTKALRMASSKSLPDVLQLDASEMPTFAEAGGLIPLKDLGLTTKDIPEGIVNFGSYEGTYYGAARTVNTLALFYNKDTLDKAGLKVPTTWAEMRETAKKLTHSRQYGLALSAGGAEDGVFQFTPFMWSNGGDEKKLDSPEVAGALDYWKSLLKDGSLSKSTVNWTQADVNDQFMAGNAAMMINGPWQVETLNSKKGLNWGIAEIPVPKAGDDSVGPLGGGVLTVPNTGDEKREKMSAKIIGCMSGEQEQITYALNSWMVPANAKAAAEWRTKVPELDALADQVATARSRTAELGARWSSVSLALQSAFQSALTGESSEAALERAQKRATSGN